MIFTLWHNALGMEKHNRAWHDKDIADAVAEYEQAQGFIEKWSEISDVVYTYTRAKWLGHSRLSFPLPWGYLRWGALYMFPKYTLRWLLFVTAGELAKSRQVIREVRNPEKLLKLDEIAEKYSLNPENFRGICQKLLRYWVLLK